MLPGDSFVFIVNTLSFEIELYQVGCFIRVDNRFSINVFHMYKLVECIELDNQQKQ